MRHIPNVLLRFRERYEHACDKTDLPVTRLMPSAPAGFVSESQRAEHERLLALALTYASAWWWATGNDTSNIATLLPHRIAHKTCFDAAMAYRLKAVARQGAPMLRHALHLDDIGAEFYAAQNALAHLHDLAVALPDAGDRVLECSLSMLLALEHPPSTSRHTAFLPAVSTA